MAIFLASNIVPRNGATWPLVDDAHVKGGMRVVATIAERDAIDTMSRKAGMIVFVQADSKLYTLGTNLTSWSGLNQALDSASTTVAGLMSAADKTTLNSLNTNALTGLSVNTPLVTTGGKAPTISMPQATSSQDGYLKASDWVLFNSKGSGNGTVTSVTAAAPVASTGGTTPVISMPAASASTSGYLTATDWNTFNNKASSSGSVSQVSATAPIVSSGGTAPVLSMPAASSSVDGYLRATDWVLFNSKGTGTVQSVSANAPLTSSGGVNPTLSIPAASSSQNGFLRATDWVTFNSKGNGNIMTVGVQGPLVNSGTVTDPVISIPAATTSSHGYMTNADKAKLDGISANATAYTHPTGDGALHVPATGTTNSGKVLTAGSTAGSISWQTPVGAVQSVNGKTGIVQLVAADIGGLGNTDDVRFKSLGVGTAASGVSGEIRATDNITAFYSSDARLKEDVEVIENALDKIRQIRGVTFNWTQEYIEQHGGEDSYFMRKRDVGVIAQELQRVLPEAVAQREDGYLAVKYDRITALLIQAVAELDQRTR